MSLKVSRPKEGGMDPAPEGTHIARCVQVIDLGTQRSAFYNKSSRKVLIGWELSDTENEKGEPFLVWARYTISLHEKANLRGILEAWRGKRFSPDDLDKGFQLSSVLDTSCMLNIVHNENDGRTYANVSSVMALPKGQAPKERKHDLIQFDLDDYLNGDDRAKEAYATFSDNLRKTIEESEEITGDREEIPI